MRSKSMPKKAWLSTGEDGSRTPESQGSDIGTAAEYDPPSSLTSSVPESQLLSYASNTVVVENMATTSPNYGSSMITVPEPGPSNTKDKSATTVYAESSCPSSAAKLYTLDHTSTTRPDEVSISNAPPKKSSQEQRGTTYLDKKASFSYAISEPLRRQKRKTRVYHRSPLRLPTASVLGQGMVQRPEKQIYENLAAHSSEEYQSELQGRPRKQFIAGLLKSLEAAARRTQRSEASMTGALTSHHSKDLEMKEDSVMLDSNEDAVKELSEATEDSAVSTTHSQQTSAQHEELERSKLSQSQRSLSKKAPKLTRRPKKRTLSPAVAEPFRAHQNIGNEHNYQFPVPNHQAHPFFREPFTGFQPVSLSTSAPALHVQSASRTERNNSFEAAHHPRYSGSSLLASDGASNSVPLDLSGTAFNSGFSSGTVRSAVLYTPSDRKSPTGVASGSRNESPIGLRSSSNGGFHNA